SEVSLICAGTPLASPRIQTVMLADIGQHIVGDGNELDVRDGDTGLFECFTRSKKSGDSPKSRCPPRGGRGPETAPVADEQELAIAHDDTAHANIRDPVCNFSTGHCVYRCCRRSAAYLSLVC